MNASQQKEQLLQSLSDLLLDPNTSESQRQQAKQALERLVDEAGLARLAQLALASESPEVVSSVLDLVEARRGFTQLEPLLAGFLYDSSPEVRRRAMQILADRGTPQMIPYLDGIITAAMKESSIFGPDDVVAATQARQRILGRSGWCGIS